MKLFEIYFEDLNEEAQKRLCDEWNTSLEDENWETFPLTSIERDEEIIE